MTIVEYLKSPDSYARLSSGRVWLYWEESEAQWVIMKQSYGKQPKRFAASTEEEVAIALFDKALEA